MHQHSLTAHAEERCSGNLSKRCQKILGYLENVGYLGRSDRQIMTALGFVDPNAVRPRVSDLIRQGVLEECGSVRDPATGKQVRRVRIKRPAENLELFG